MQRARGGDASSAASDEGSCTDFEREVGEEVVAVRAQVFKLLSAERDELTKKLSSPKIPFHMFCRRVRLRALATS